jgi:hypothetical protein
MVLGIAACASNFTGISRKYKRTLLLDRRSLLDAFGPQHSKGERISDYGSTGDDRDAHKCARKKQDHTGCYNLFILRLSALATRKGFWPPLFMRIPLPVGA